MPKLKNWGGARPGSGRPIVGKAKRQITTIALEPALLAALERYAKQAGLSRNEAVNRLLSERLLSVQKPLIDAPAPPVDALALALANVDADPELTPRPTLAPCLADVLSYSPARFGQWLAENLLPLSPEQQSQYKAPWDTSPGRNLDALRQYGPELIEAIKTGNLKLHPEQAKAFASMDDQRCRNMLIDLAGITL